jgi:hypothetical protein
MTTYLLHPVTRTPCAFVALLRGHVCLRADYVTPQTRWFPLAQIEAANPVYTVTPQPQNFDSGLDYCFPMPYVKRDEQGRYWIETMQMWFTPDDEVDGAQGMWQAR